MTKRSTEEAPAHSGGGAPRSRQVAWFETFTYAERIAASHGVALACLPIAGTPLWCEMPDDDARKLLALVLGGVREALNHEVTQEHCAQASPAISAAADWPAIAREILQWDRRHYIRRTA